MDLSHYNEISLLQAIFEKPSFRLEATLKAMHSLAKFARENFSGLEYTDSYDGFGRRGPRRLTCGHDSDLCEACRLEICPGRFPRERRESGGGGHYNGFVAPVHLRRVDVFWEWVE